MNVSKLADKIAGAREMLRFDNGWALVIDRLLHPHARVAVYRMGNVEVVADRSGGDLGSIRTCLATGMYRDLLCGLKLRRELRVLDIGANVGGFSLLLRAMGHEFERLVAVELNPNTAQRLRYNLGTNLIHNGAVWQVLNAGVWSESGSVTMDLGWGSTGDSLQRAQGQMGLRSSTVPLSTLDDLIAGAFGDLAIDLCKIDIEGAEHDVFSSAHCERIAQVRFLLIEVHEREPGQSDRLTDRLRSLGFRAWPGRPQGQDAVVLFENSRVQ